MALHGGIVAPINKGKLETELGITFHAFGTGWRYDWQSNGMLARVVRPDGKEVSFAYDALGRRIRKTYAGTTTHFVWDGNVPLHEWTEEVEENMVTWLFEQDTFVPAAKLVANGDCFSIISDYLGTPLQAYDKEGNRCGSRSCTSTGGKGNARHRLFHSNIKGSTRMQKRGCITIVLGITTQMLGVISAKAR